MPDDETPDADAVDEDAGTYTVIEPGGVAVVHHADDLDALKGHYEAIVGKAPGNRSAKTMVEEIQAAQAG